MFNPKLGASLHSISRNIDDNLIELVENSTIRSLELFQRLFLENAENVKAQIKKLSVSEVKIASIHVDFYGLDISSENEAKRQNAIRSAFESIALAEELNAQIIVMHSSLEPIEIAERDERKKRAKESLFKIAEKCGKAGKRLAIELLPRTCLGNSIDELLELALGTPEDIVGFCLDTNHLMDKPHILPDAVKILGKRLIATHLSDYDGIDEKHQLPGTGVLDWENFMKALKQINYTGPFNFECVFNDNTRPQERIAMLEQSFDYLVNFSSF